MILCVNTQQINFLFIKLDVSLGSLPAVGPIVATLAMVPVIITALILTSAVCKSSPSEVAEYEDKLFTIIDYFV